MQRAPLGAEDQDNDPAFDPDGNAQRIKQETAARAQASLEKAAKASRKKRNPPAEVARPPPPGSWPSAHHGRLRLCCLIPLCEAVL